jgi:hypothetical protein
VAHPRGQQGGGGAQVVLRHRVGRPRRGQHHGVACLRAGLGEPVEQHADQRGVGPERLGHDDVLTTGRGELLGDVDPHVEAGGEERGHDDHGTGQLEQHVRQGRDRHPRVRQPHLDPGQRPVHR